MGSPVWMIDVVVLLVIVAVVVALIGRRRLSGVGRGLGGGVREFKRARAGLPPADPRLDDDDQPRTG